MTIKLHILHFSFHLKFLSYSSGRHTCLGFNAYKINQSRVSYDRRSIDGIPCNTGDRNECIHYGRRKGTTGDSKQMAKIVVRGAPEPF